MSTTIKFDLELGEELVRFLFRLADDMGKGPAEAIRLSLGLMRIAQDAKVEGNGLAIVTPDGEVEQDIVGI